jgi:protein-S-isoprenylcysteine O-methyltransferase Ste14
MEPLRAVGYAITTVLIYLGVPLLGWGLLDLPGFFALPARTAYAAVVGVFGLLIGYQAIRAPEGFRGSRGDKAKRVRRQSIVTAFMVAMLYVALFGLPFADRRSIGVIALGPDGRWAALGPAGRWAGLVLAALGLGLIFWSGVALGRMYSKQVTIQEDHHLVTDGLYGLIRHPRYLGVLCLAVGFTLLFRSWIALTLWLPLLAIILMRIRDEEAVMGREFGEEWEAYCQRSRKLIPYLY